VWYIWNKEKNATLKGDNDDGSSYSQPVSYWMPIDDTGEGIHDASWQTAYGGTWYKKHGSHGCVNTPPSVMKKVFAYVKQLNDKYHTYHTTRQFKSTARGTVSVSGGFYGWTIKTEAEAKALATEILKGKDFTRSPITSGSRCSDLREAIE
ncbi:hypothetical protein WP50_17595, partial [Lactiplantibacillus plantarum]